MNSNMQIPLIRFNSQIIRFSKSGSKLSTRGLELLNFDISRFGMEVFRASPRQADLMIVAGRVSNKMAPVLRQIYDQMAAPKWVIAMGACASSGGMFNNYAIVQGVDHVVPVDIYLPGCPPRPEMLMDAILKLHEQISNEKLGVNRAQVIKEVEAAALAAKPTYQLNGLLR